MKSKKPYSVIANRKHPALFTLIFISCFALFGTSCKVPSEAMGAELSAADNEKATLAALAATRQLQDKNTRRANTLIENLYIEYEDFSLDSGESLTLGAQRGYFAEPGSEEMENILIKYGRVWAYDAGIGLSLAVHRNERQANERALWILKNGRTVPNPKKPGEGLFGGWPFSINLAHMGDNWEDRRLVTGANTYTLIGLAEYIASDFFDGLPARRQREFREFFADALEGILYHFETSGPNKDLITAGWSLNILDDYEETGNTYYDTLDLVGYGADKVACYPDRIAVTRSENIVTEHCNDILKLFNFTLDNYTKLLGTDNPPYSYNKLNKMRLALRNGMFKKLYNRPERRMITGRSAEGEPSEFTAIDNASWLAISVRLEELNKKQIRLLSDSLAYTIDNFAKDFDINGKKYYGTHYFPDGFKDPYIVASTSFSSSYHMEATCGLICGLLDFTEAFPDHENASTFRVAALKLWIHMQYVIRDIGFIYASSAESATFESNEASVSAIWYLMTLDYIDKKTGF